MRNASAFLRAAAEEAINQAPVWAPTAPMTRQIMVEDCGDERWEYEIALGQFRAILYSSGEFDAINTVDNDQLCLMYLFAAEMLSND